MSSRLDPSLGDVLERLIDGIDLSASKQHEIVEGLASQGIVNWQSFVFMEEEHVESIHSLSRISKTRLLYFKDLVMTNIEKGVRNADLPFMYTKEMYNQHVQNIRLGSWKNRKNSFKVDNDDAPSAVARFANSKASSTVSPERNDETPPSKRNRIEIKSKSTKTAPHASSKRQALEMPSKREVVDDASLKQEDDDGTSWNWLPTPEHSDEGTPQSPSPIDLTVVSSDSESTLESWYHGMTTKKRKFQKLKPVPTSQVAAMKKEPQRKPPPTSKVATMKTKEENQKRAKSDKTKEPKQKRAKSDKVDALRSFSPLCDTNHASDIHTVILGTMCSLKSFGKKLSEKEILLRGGSGPQYYGNSRNSFWNIVGSALGFQRHKISYNEQVKVLNAKGYALWNVLSQAERTQGRSSDSDLIRKSFVPNDLPQFVFDHPNLNRFVFIGNSADTFRKADVWGDWLDRGEAVITTTTGQCDDSSQMPIFTKFWIQGREPNPETFERTTAAFGKKKSVETVDDPEEVKLYKNTATVDGDGETSGRGVVTRRLIELIVMPSTSPAYANVRPPQKEELWHKACFRLQEPPMNYVCPGCELRSRTRTTNTDADTIKEEPVQRHWFHDCPYQKDWKLFKRQESKKKSKGIDPFNWYV